MHLTTGEVIRRIRKSLGMTQAELGVILGYTQPAISQLERGGAAVHDVRVLRRIAKALHVPLAILVVESDEEADVDRRNFLRTSMLGTGAVITAGAARHAANETAATGAVRVGATDVAEINAAVNQIHELDLLVGGDRLCRVAANEVRYVTQLLNSGSYTDDVGGMLTSAGAKMMTAAGWVHYDAGRLDDARRYYADAAQAGSAAGDGIAAAHALGNASHLMVNRLGSTTVGDQSAVQYAQAASRAALPRGGPKLRALMAIREAEAFGSRHDQSGMSDAISRAYRAYESTRGDDPDWVYLPEAQMSGVTGKAYMRLGQYETAATYLQDAIDSSAAWPRERASWLLHLAHNFAQAGEVGQASAMLTDNIASISDLASARLQRRLTDFGVSVRFFAKVPEVQDFLGKLSELST
ncbi:helix-turn-helix domain-containing protein [Nocardia takedensis]